MPTEILQSRQNPHVKQLRQAFARSGRTDDGLVAIEGLTMLQEALRSGVALHQVFLRQDCADTFPSQLAPQALPASVPVHVLSADAFDSAVATEAPQGIAALVQAPNHARNLHVRNLEMLQATDALVLVLDSVQDPGNLGTILRSAEAFGATCVLRLPGTASEWNLKAMRASAGSVWRLPVVAASHHDALAALQANGFQLAATVVQGGSLPEQVDWRQPTALLIGSEGRGLSQLWLDHATVQVTLPMPGPVESLNAAIAASLLLYQASRSREAPPSRSRS